MDDIPEQIAFAGALLREEGYRVSALTSGTAALRFLEVKRPDLIMLDIKMESIDGLEVCKRIKLNSLTKDIPIIFLTAQTKPEIIKRCFELGGCDYIAKPFVREEFLARVKTHLDDSARRLALADANRELRLFCSAVSHDLKSPLGVIKLLIDSLKEELGAVEAPALDIMDMICDKADRLTLMIERLLEFSKMCNITPEKEPLELSSIVAEIYDELKLSEPERDIRLTMEELPVVYGDDVLIKMLVKNILANAFKFTSRRKKALISVTAVKDGDYDVVTFSDNGAGFDMTYADKMFGVFQRLHTSEEFEGTGVGLALCDRIMKRHGGYITAYGEVDKGASFSLHFYRR